MKKILLWLRIVRPGTLAAAASPVITGLVVASQYASTNWCIAVVTLLTAFALQIMANLINDYYDFARGLDKAGRAGPKRALSEGEVTEGEMLFAVLVAAFCALSGGLFLVVSGGIPILLIGVFSLFFAWLYTATPFSLSFLGLADLFVFLFFGPVASAGTAYLQTGNFLTDAVLTGAVSGCVSMAVLTVNNLRDRDGDRAAGKKTVVVRFGKLFGEIEYLSLFCLCAGILVFVKGAILSCAVAPAGVVLFFFVRRASGRRYNRLLVFTGLANLLFSALYLIDRCALWQIAISYIR